jgi:uncharacterized protein (UPF0210 family)
MSDLVKRLRREGVKVQGIHLGMRVCDEAADRIEALEAALRYTAETAAGELNYTGQSRSTRAALQKINVMARAALTPPSSSTGEPSPNTPVPDA